MQKQRRFVLALFREYSVTGRGGVDDFHIFAVTFHIDVEIVRTRIHLRGLKAQPDRFLAYRFYALSFRHFRYNEVICF